MMVKVVYRGAHITHWLPQAKTGPTWHIEKKYRLNPLTNQAQDYSPDYYRTWAMAGDDPRTLPDHPDAWRVRAIQIMLHQQTNYDYLVHRGLYNLPRDRVCDILRTWYQHIAQRFPRYRSACEFEFARHIRKYDVSRQTVPVDQ
jgi:hypothetical protein